MNYMPFLIISLLLMPYSIVSAACYTLTDSTGNIIYQSNIPPVDLSGSISKAVESKFPGAHLTIHQSNCSSEKKNIHKAEKDPEKVINNLVKQNPTYQDGGLSRYGESRSESGYRGGSDDGCGSRGGPGWRRPDGKCASWSD